MQNIWSPNQTESLEFLTDYCFNLILFPPQVHVHLKFKCSKNIWAGQKKSTSWHSGWLRVARYHCILFSCSSSLGLADQRNMRKLHVENSKRGKAFWQTKTFWIWAFSPPEHVPPLPKGWPVAHLGTKFPKPPAPTKKKVLLLLEQRNSVPTRQFFRCRSKIRVKS